MFLAHHVSLKSIQLLKLGHILCFVTVSAAALAYTLAGLTNRHLRCGVVFMGAGDMAS